MTTLERIEHALNLAEMPNFKFLPGMLVEQGLQIRLVKELKQDYWEGVCEKGCTDEDGNLVQPTMNVLLNKEALFWVPVLDDKRTRELINRFI